MSLFFPHERYRRITDIPAGHFASIGVRALVLDVDNTLTTHDNPAPGEGVLDWLAAVQSAGVQCIILSNNTPERVTPFAEMLSLSFEADGRKPLPGGVLRACRRMKAEPTETALIGDQIFTDVMAARLSGVHAILVDPIEPETTRFFRLKRRLERPFLAAFDRAHSRR
jgi:hypothetical protein